jgi:hypothetical protein
MFFFYGNKTARIKKYTEYQITCSNCKKNEMDVKIFRDYFHVYFIPFCPMGDNVAHVRCKVCDEPVRDENIKKNIKKQVKAPFYLFSIPIIILSVITLGIILNLKTQKEKDLMINHPKVGDVYLMVNTKNELSTYYFNIVFDIKNDSIMMYRNRYEYSQYTVQLNRDDYFDKSNVYKISSTELKTMHESSAINAIIRNYNKDNEFNRFK